MLLCSTIRAAVPGSYWASTQPMAGRYLYGLVMALSGSPAPADPHNWATDREVIRPEAQVDPRTLLVMRMISIFAAALGLALITWRLRWGGLVGSLLFLAIPHVRVDLAEAALDGMLILTFGLCAISFGRRWFTAVCAIAAAVKLTALGLWPLLLWPKATKIKHPSVSLGMAWFIWTLLLSLPHGFLADRSI